jgi:hypothetical protein
MSGETSEVNVILSSFLLKNHKIILSLIKEIYIEYQLYVKH